MKELQPYKKTILVTGASRGLGLVTSKYLVELGYEVVSICDIDGNVFEPEKSLSILLVARRT